MSYTYSYDLARDWIHVTIMSNMVQLNKVNDWCRENFGPHLVFDSDQGVILPGVWGFRFHRNINTWQFYFLNPADATLFTLRWR